MKKKESKLFRNIVIVAVLIIPFMYSFFYLKAYWNPYGEGNIDNIPVAIVNEDKGDKGEKLVESIKSSGKLKLQEMKSKEAEDCLNNTKCYASIKIPADFTESMESAGEKDKKHAMITYSPNQKTNFLASQIINSVVNAVEKNLDNQVNSAIVGELSDNLNEVPKSLDKISNGFGDMLDGTNKLLDGSQTLASGTTQLNSGSKALKNGALQLASGTTELNDKYSIFNKGLISAYDGADELNAGLKTLNKSVKNVDKIPEGVEKLKNGSATLKKGINDYIEGVNTSNAAVQSLIENLMIYNATHDESKLAAAMAIANGIASNHEGQEQLTQGAALLKAGANELDNGLYVLKQSTQNLGDLKVGVSKLNNGSKDLKNGMGQLIDGSKQIKAGISSLDNGSSKLYKGIGDADSGISTLEEGAYTLSDGISTLDSSVASAKTELDKKNKDTKEKLESLDGIEDYAETPVEIKTEAVNEVDSYGTSFAPLFISIGLWVGALMSFVVLYYDKKKRFGILGEDSNERTKRTLAYHAIATISGVVLAALLHIFLDMNVVSVPLYYFSAVLIANTFMAIMELLIVNFGDVGKFLGLIILVLQLAASGGTFPIETVDTMFRGLNPFLPMTYTIRLLKESLMSTEAGLLLPNILIVVTICVLLSGFNIIMSIKKDKESI